MGRIVRIKSSELKPLTKEENKRIRELAKKPIVYDEDCPPLTDEQIKEIRKQLKQKREEQKKEVLSIRVSKATMRKAKALGPGYSSVLAKLLDMSLNDPEMIKKCL